MIGLYGREIDVTPEQFEAFEKARGPVDAAYDAAKRKQWRENAKAKRLARAERKAAGVPPKPADYQKERYSIIHEWDEKQWAWVEVRHYNWEVEFRRMEFIEHVTSMFRRKLEWSEEALREALVRESMAPNFNGDDARALLALLTPDPQPNSESVVL